MAPVGAATTSTRWCPTPEQLMILEEMYRGGVRTPNATQIQHITAHLSLYGKIEGKNVFYWFQNHKARDRQKLRRRLAKHLLLQHHQHHLLYHHDHHFFDHLHHLPPPLDDPFFPSLHPPTLPPPGFHPVSALDHHYFPPSPSFIVPPQGDVSREYAMNLSWKMEVNPLARDDVRDHEDQAMRGPDDWVFISSNLNSRPLKTLELFPVTSSTDESPSPAC